MRLAVFVLLVVVVSTPGAGAWQYSDAIDLGVGDGSQAVNVSSDGRVLIERTEDEWTYGYVWDKVNGTRQIPFWGGGKYVFPRGINNKGQVVGIAIDSSGYGHAFLWDVDNGMTDLSALYRIAIACAINNKGQIAGVTYVYGSDLLFTCTLIDQGVVTEIDVTTGWEFGPADINENGVIVGSSDVLSRGFVWDPVEGISYLDPLPGHVRSYGAGINDLGEIAGYSSTGSSGTEHAFIYRNGLPQDLGTFGGDPPRAHASGINNLGVVVGRSCTTSGYAHAFYWDGAMHDLGTLGGDASSARGISEGGLIVGSASSADGGTHAVIWEPIPEPSSILSVTCGLAGTVALLRRRTGPRHA